jgi:membrane-associated phospholipid phosphatase
MAVPCDSAANASSEAAISAFEVWRSRVAEKMADDMEQTTMVEDAGRAAQTMGERLRGWPPAAAMATLSVGGAAVLMVVMIAIGLVITSSSLSAPIIAWDSSLGRWFELHRTATLNTWTDIGSILAGSGTILLVAGISVAVLLIRRLWYEAAFVVIGLCIESSAFLVTALIVDRPRPTIEPLDPLPVTSSFPSGHAAAAIALYVGLAIVISSHTERRAIRVPVWIAAIVLPIWVGLSRVYRGMHHPTDVLASIVLGVGALCFALLAVRAGTVVANHRHRDRPVASPSRSEPSKVRV